MATTAPSAEIPTAAWRAKLVVKLVKLGYLGTDLADIIAPGRTRGEMADDMIARQKRAERAEP
jgi:hypothetical protein